MPEWLSSTLVWIEAHPALASWIQGIGSVSAVAIALIAASLAYKGAVRQAQATENAQKASAAEHRSAIARALWAEFMDCHSRIGANRLRIARRLPGTTWKQILVPVTTDIGEALRADVGRLSPDFSMHAVLALKNLQFIAADLNRLIEQNDQICDENAVKMIAKLEGAASLLHTRMAAMTPDTGIAYDKAEQLLNLMKKEISALEVDQPPEAPL